MSYAVTCSVHDIYECVQKVPISGSLNINISSKDRSTQILEKKSRT